MPQRRVELGLRSETIRRANLSAIVRELHLSGTLSRSKLGARTGLTRGAIRLLIGELAASGLVRETSGPAIGRPGRPSAVVRLREDGPAVLALEISVDSLAVAVVGLGGRVIREKRINRPREAFSVEETLAALSGLVERMNLQARGAPSIVGVGVALAGIVRRDDGFVAMAPNLGWHDVPLGPQIAETLGTSLPVWIANEADLGALAEHRRGAAIGADNVVYVTGEVGVGGSLIMDGRPMAGASGYSGEVGHIPLAANGVRCGCGSIGCWETVIGERALLERAGYPVDGGRAAIDALIRDARFGRRRPIAALNDVGQWLGRGIAALTNVLNPSMVVVGGLFERVYPFIEQPLSATFSELALAPSARIVSIVPAKLGLDAPLLGAAELAFEAVLDDPAALAQWGTHQEWRVVA